MLNKRRCIHSLQKRPKKAKHILILALFMMAFSQSFAQYEIKKNTINSGGATMEGGGFTLKSSIGQTDASNTITGGSYSLNGGLWHQNQTTNTEDLIFNNGFE